VSRGASRGSNAKGPPADKREALEGVEVLKLVNERVQGEADPLPLVQMVRDVRLVKGEK
jgi:hypothetical protein